jgi:hypothetical protein
MTDLFDWTPTPAHQRHSPTSKAAAESIKPRVGPLHRLILDMLAMGGAGATDEQMQCILNMPANTQRPRRRELQQAGLVVDSGITWATTSGRKAVVWTLAPASGRSEGAQ